MSEEYLQLCMSLIIHGGNARSLAAEAIRAAKNGDFVTARDKLSKADEEGLQAHKIQNEVVTKEMSGEEPLEVRLLMVHAQDHVMTGILYLDLISELVDILEAQQ